MSADLLSSGRDQPLVIPLKQVVTSHWLFRLKLM
jgi:hypothetical protein